MRKKVVLSLLAFVLLFSTTSIMGTKSASAASPSPNHVATNDPALSENSGEDVITIQGFKGDAVKLALSLIKTAIHWGGDVLSFIVRWLDPDAADYLKHNKDRVTGAIDKLEDYIDEAEYITQTTIKEKLFSFLDAADVPEHYALQIADAIARTVTWLLM